MSIKNIPEGWDIIRLGDLLSFKNGLNKEKEAFGKGTPIINYTDVYKKTFLYASDIKGKVLLSNREISLYLVQKGDVFFTRTSETINEIGYASVLLNDMKDTVFSGFILRGRDKTNKLDISFKKYCFSTQHFRNEVIKKSSMTTRALTNGSFLSDVFVHIPPLSEQKRIAEVLGCWDEGIEELEKVISLKEQQKKWLMQRLLTGKTRLPGFNGAWREVKLGALCKYNYIKIEKGKMIVSESIKKGNIPVIAGGRSVPYYHNKHTHDQTCITISASGAYAGYVWLHQKPIWASDCNVLQGLNNYNTLFLYFILKNKQDEIYRLQTGGAQPHIYAADLQIIHIPDIDLEEQSAIASILSEADNEISQLKQKLNLFKQQKKWLMQQLLTGKKRLAC